MDARKQRFERDDLPELLDEGDEVVVANRKKVLRFPLGPDTDWDAVAKVALGRSGALRAPTVRIGDRWYVGYHEELWNDELAG